MAGVGPVVGGLNPDSPPRTPSTAVPSQPPSPDASSSEEDELDMDIDMDKDTGAGNAPQIPKQPEPVPQVPEDPQAAWMALQVNQSKMVMEMMTSMQQQMKGMQDEIMKLKGVDDTPAPSPAPSEPMEPDVPEKEVLKDDPYNPWRPCHETLLSPDRSTIQGVRPDGTAWSLPTAKIRFEDISKYPDTRWRLDLSSPADQQPTQKEKILIELEAANKGISDLMEKLRIMYHGPGFFQTIKGFAIEPSDVPVTRKVFGHVQEFARAIVKGEKVPKLGELRSPFPIVMAGPKADEHVKAMVQALEEKEFETSSARDQTQEEAFGKLTTTHISEERRARMAVLRDQSTSLYLEVVSKAVGYPSSDPMRGILKGSLKRYHMSLEAWLKAKIQLRSDSLRFFNQGNPLVTRLKWTNPMSPGVFDQTVIEDIKKQASHQAKSMRVLLGHFGFPGERPSGSGISGKRSFSKTGTGPKVLTPAMKKQRKDFSPAKGSTPDQEKMMDLFTKMNALHNQFKASVSGKSKGGSSSSRGGRGKFQGKGKGRGKTSDKSHRKE